MRLARLPFVGWFVSLSLVVLWGCAETPRCVDLDDDGEYTLDCNAGKVPVCGSDPAELYSSRTGALLPVPPEGETCGDRERCRERPRCDGQEVACPDGLGAQCVLGTITEITVVTPMPDSGPPPEEDAGGADEDAGTADEDAGTADEDAGADDAGVDSGPGRP